MAETKNYEYELAVSLVIFQPERDRLLKTLQCVAESGLRVKIFIYDNSPEPVDMASVPFSHLQVTWDASNVGFGGGHNRNMEKGIGLAPYFLILNPDIYFEPKMLAEIIKRVQRDPDVGLAIPQICHPSGQMQPVNRRVPRPQDYAMNFLNAKMGPFLKSAKHSQYLLKDIDHGQSFVCPVISGCFMLFRSNILKQLQGFDCRFFLYFEDTDLSRRAARITKIVVFSDLKAYHHWHRGSHSDPKLFAYFVTSLVKYFNKWGWVSDKEREFLNAQLDYYSLPLSDYKGE